MSVNLRKDGRWLVVYQIDGKRKYEYFPGGSEGEKKARAREKELKQAGSIHRYTPSPDRVTAPLFSILVNEYLSAKVIELPATSIKNMIWKFTKIILPEIGTTQAMKIDAERLRNYVKKRLATPVTKRIGNKDNQKKIPVRNPDGQIRMISKTTIHRELSDIMAVLNWSVKEGWIPRNPAAKFEKPKRDDKIIMPPTMPETQAILSNAAPHLVRALIISFYTGLRPGNSELFGIQWKDIDLISDHILIMSAKKGGPRSRILPLHPEFKAKLVEWQAEDLKTNATFLIRWEGKPVKEIDHAFKRAKERAGITRQLRLYDFRHAFATNLLKYGGNLKSVSEMLGHSRPDTTTRIYQHTDIEQHRENIQKLPGLDPFDNMTDKMTDNFVVKKVSKKRKQKQ